MKKIGKDKSMNSDIFAISRDWKVEELQGE